MKNNIVVVILRVMTALVSLLAVYFYFFGDSKLVGALLFYLGAFMIKWFQNMPKFLDNIEDFGYIKYIPIMQSAYAFSNRIVGLLNSLMTLVGVLLLVFSYILNSTGLFRVSIGMLILNYTLASIAQIHAAIKLERASKHKRNSYNFIDILRGFLVYGLVFFPVIENLGMSFINTSLSTSSIDQGGF